VDTISIITTEDGSHSLRHAALDETYHSVHGAVQESKHVFLHHGLEFKLGRIAHSPVRILEIGFGTGLNAFLTSLYPIPSGQLLYYESWEAHPVSGELIEKLNYSALLGSPELFSAIHTAPWNKTCDLTAKFSIHKHRGDLLVDPLTGSFDLIFYDAFAPSKQPEMWTLPVLTKVTHALSKEGVFVTYCAKGQLKRDLSSLGLQVETLPGPPGKKEMVRAVR